MTRDSSRLLEARRYGAANNHVERNPFAYQPWRDKRTLEGMFDILEADIVVLQETKIQRKDLRDDMVLVPGWDVFFSLPKHKKGYSGVAIYTRNATCAPIRAEEGITGILCPPNSSTSFRDLPAPQQIGGYPTTIQLSAFPLDPATLDSEGRCLILEFPAFVLIGVYSPANRDETRDHFRLAFLNALDARVRNLVAHGKRVVLTGDLNIIRSELDTANAEEQLHKDAMTGGMTAEYVSTPARRLLNQLLLGGKVIGERDEARAESVLWDICRVFHPARKGMFTCWNTKINARPGNFGSRIDYVLCSLDMIGWFCDANIQEGLIGSDHCPVYATIKDWVDIGSVVHRDRAISLRGPLPWGASFACGNLQDSQDSFVKDSQDSVVIQSQNSVVGDVNQDSRDIVKDIQDTQDAQNSVVNDIHNTQHSIAIHIKDIMNPPGMFKDGIRQRDWNNKDLLPLSAKLIPEFDRRRNIRDMFTKLSFPYGDVGRDERKGDKEGREEERKEDIEIPQIPQHDKGLMLSRTVNSPSPTHLATHPVPNHPPISPQARKRAAESSESPFKRTRPGASRAQPPKGQTTLKAFFKPNSMTEIAPIHACERDDPPPHEPAQSSPAFPATSKSATPASPTRTRESEHHSPNPFNADDQEDVIDPIVAKETWSRLLSKRIVPRCEHNEPCLSYLTKKPGINCGRSFYMCPRPLGPSGQKEKNTQWRCATFIWSSDWTGDG